MKGHEMKTTDDPGCRFSRSLNHKLDTNHVFCVKSTIHMLWSESALLQLIL